MVGAIIGQNTMKNYNIVYIIYKIAIKIYFMKDELSRAENLSNSFDISYQSGIQSNTSLKTHKILDNPKID